MTIRRALELTFGIFIAGAFVGMGLLAILIGVLVLAGADSMDVEPSLLHRLAGLQPLGIGSIAFWAAFKVVRQMRDERRADKPGEVLPGAEAERAVSATSARLER